MIYFTGDLHGEFDKLKAACKKLKKADTLIVCGDFGFIWNGDKQEQQCLKRITKLKRQILFVPGCHDNYDLLREYPRIPFAGGTAGQIGQNLYALMRGQIYTIDEKTVFAFGGGISEDAPLRQEGTTWWKEENPEQEEFDAAIANLAAQGNKVDYIVTHDTALFLKQFMGVGSDLDEVGNIHAFLNVLAKQVDFTAWFFGKYHQDKLIPPRYYAMFRSVLPAPGQEIGKKKKKNPTK